MGNFLMHRWRLWTSSGTMKQIPYSSNKEDHVERHPIFVDPSCTSESPTPESHVLDLGSRPKYDEGSACTGYSQGTETTAKPQKWDLSNDFQSENTAGGHIEQPIPVSEGNDAMVVLSPDRNSTTTSHCNELDVGLTKSYYPNLPPVNGNTLRKKVNENIGSDLTAASKSIRQCPVRDTSANCGQKCYLNGFTNLNAQISEESISPHVVHFTSVAPDMNAGCIDFSDSNSLNDDLEKLKFDEPSDESSRIADVEAVKKVNCPHCRDPVVKCSCSNPSLANQNDPQQKVTIVASRNNSQALEGSNHQSSNEQTVRCSLSRFYCGTSGQKSEFGKLKSKHSTSPSPVDYPCEGKILIETPSFGRSSSNKNAESVDELMDTGEVDSSLNQPIPQLLEPVLDTRMIVNSSDRIRPKNLNQHSVDFNKQNIEPVVRCNLISVFGSKFPIEKEGNETKSANAWNGSSLNDRPLNPMCKETVDMPPQLGHRNSADIVGEITYSEKLYRKRKGEEDRREENVGMNSGTIRCILPPESGSVTSTENDKNEVEPPLATSPVISEQTVRCIFPEDRGQIVLNQNEEETMSENVGNYMENLTLPLFESSSSNENREDSAGQMESNQGISKGQTVRCIFPPGFGCHLSNLEGENSADQFHSENSTVRSRANGGHKQNDEQIVRCRLPIEWVSDATSDNYENFEGFAATAEEVDTGLQPYCQSEWDSSSRVRHSERQSKSTLNFSESTTTLRLEESEIVVDSLNPDTKCMLPFTQQGDDEIHSHIDNCETVLYGVQLRETHASFVKSVPNVDDSSAHGIINQVLGNICKEFVLENSCKNSECLLVHNVKLNLELPEHDFIMVHKIFTKWFLEHSKQPNLKVLLELMSSLTRDYSDLLPSILNISQAFFKLAQNFRRPFGIKLIERLIHLVDLQIKDAIRTILIFTITRETDKADIANLLEALGVFEPEMTTILESIGCIWHITEAYDFPPNTLFSILKESLQMVDISAEFKNTKDKIAAELMKLPRSVLRKQFHIVGKFLRTFYPLNSQASFNLNSIVFYGVIPETDFDSDRQNSYRSSKVSSTGPINWDWEYWDLSEARLKACHFMMAKISLDNQDEEVTVPPHTTPFKELNMENLIDDDQKISSAFLPMQNDGTLALDESTSVSMADMNRIEQALKTGQFRDVSRVIVSYNHPAKRKSLSKCLRFLTKLLARYVKEKLPHAIYEILAFLPRSYTYDDGLSIRKSFVSSVNALVLIFYERMDYKSALKLLKTLRVSEENSLEYMPNDSIDPQTFAVVCSDIHLECRCFLESLKILLYGNSMEYIKYNLADQLCVTHFFQLEFVILKMFKTFLKERLASYALYLFRAILLAQRNLRSPINIGIYYEVVLCNSFVTTHKASCDLHDGANLYITVDRTCGNEVRFRSATYRSLMVKLLQGSAPEDIIRRTLLLCQKLNVYPVFRIHSISLGSHLVTDEMYLYISYFFKYFLEGNDGPSLLQKPCSVKIVKMAKPSRKPFPVLEEIVKVTNEIPDALERLKGAFKRLVGGLYQDLFIEFSSPTEATIPTVGIETLMEVLA